MAGIVTIFMGNPGLALMAVILGGGFQILLGLSRVGQYIALVPYPVVSGFMSGIGCIILIFQLGPLVGHAASPEGVVATLKAIPGFYGEPVWDAALTSGLVLVIVYFTPSRMAKLVPPSYWPSSWLPLSPMFSYRTPLSSERSHRDFPLLSCPHSLGTH